MGSHARIGGRHLRVGGLVGSGRTADVYALEHGGEGEPDGGAWVLRRYRDSRGDASRAADVMAYVRDHGYPVPRVQTAASRTDLVMERLTGPTLVGAMTEGVLTPAEAGASLARLLCALHTIPARLSTDPGVRVLHLDLHPDNVLLTPAGPMVIDWDDTEEGPPGLDWSMSAVILAQIAVAEGDPRAAPVREVLAALLAGCPDPALLTGPIGRKGRTGQKGSTGGRGELGRARERRAANPTMSRTELELLGDAEELIRELLAGREDF
ncbi:phosphotransferase [Streptomyces sp. CWNU-52B]|uniref:phosphotransferase n=1 Tax=unclassified Streptomyces TaxID=2593676 RepID=UPI0039C46380